MRRMLYPVGALAVIMVAFAADVRPSAAYIWYPWCAHYNGRGAGGAASCGFSTYAQCMAAASGQQGTCEMNPYEGGPQPQQYQTRKKRRN